MFDLQESLEKYLSQLKKNKATNAQKKSIKIKLTRAGILNRNGKLKKLPIK